MFYIYYSQYKYYVLIKRLINKLIIFQWFINKILFDYLNDFYIVYLDNILIYLIDLLEYKLYIKKVLKQLYIIRIQTDIKKNKFNIK